ncbi:response regulator [Nocardioides hankookensis]|uniref:Response regulator n=1 Tax=Nocardioides hankookensis TaxID=443157 RepID=A0ABW1LEW0_9ACTN
MTRVLVVDDEPQIGHAIRTALERDGDEVLLAGSGVAGVDLVATSRPDLLILDLHLPDIDGTEVVRRVRPWFAHPILVLSGASDEDSRVAALDAGADDFLGKPFGLAELRARLRALQRRSAGGADDTTQRRYGDLVVDLAGRTVRVAGQEVLLTPTEWRLLVAFLANPGALLTHHRLLAEGWSTSYGDETRQALRTHIRSLRAKIGDPAADPLYIRTESGVGYRWVATEGSGAPGTGAPGAAAAADTVHDLSNALTGLRLAVDLAQMEADPPPYLDQMSTFVDQAVRLVGDLERAREAP